MAKPPVKKTAPEGQKGWMRLSVPWELTGYSRGNIATQSCEIIDMEGFEQFLWVRTGLHELYIRETERTRRIGMALAAALLAVACLIPVFAPAGRETISYWIGLALFVFAAGSMGYSTIKAASGKRQLSLTKDAPNA